MTRTLLTLLLVIPGIAMGQKKPLKYGNETLSIGYYKQPKEWLSYSIIEKDTTLEIRGDTVSLVKHMLNQYQIWSTQQQSHIATLERVIMELAKENDKLRKQIKTHK